MKIVMCAAEAVPFVKVGGLGDVLGALPREFAEEGHEVTLILPYYSVIARNEYEVKRLEKAGDLSVDMAGRRVNFDLLELRIGLDRNVRVLFIEKDHYFARSGIYSHAHNQSFTDEGELWVFFQLAVIRSLRALDLRPDILHVHDFHTALLPALIRFHEKEFFTGTRSLLTLHNLLFQGVFDYGIYQLSGLPSEQFYPMSDFEYFGKTNFVKSGIIYSDAFNTVSEHYAKELLTNAVFSYGLYDLLQHQQHKFSGILNGADYRFWNPASDKHIPYNYDKESLEIKAKNREELVTNTSLRIRERTMVMGIVARMTKQKGFQLLLDALDGIMKRDVVLIILASGDEDLEKEWERQKVYYPDRIHYERNYNESLSHEIQAGCDVFLMPSFFEPCGLSQMYAMRYGTPPVAFSTGGLADTITDRGEDKTGFLFYEYRVDHFLKALDEAINQFNFPYWKVIQRNGMQKEFSWKLSAGKYLELYRKIRQGE